MHIVIPNNLLRKRDEKKFAHFFQLHSIKPVYHEDLQFESSPHSLVLVDEIDVLLNEDPTQFHAQLELLANCTTIGFTATLFQVTEMEHAILTRMSF